MPVNRHCRTSEMPGRDEYVRADAFLRDPCCDLLEPMMFVQLRHLEQSEPDARFGSRTDFTHEVDPLAHCDRGDMLARRRFSA